MIGSFGFIDEPAEELNEYTSHEKRFSALNDGLGRRGLGFQSGRDLLLIDLASPSATEAAPLPTRPRGPTTNLWIPVRENDSRIVGPVYRIGIRRSGALVRARADKTVKFVRGLTVVAGPCTARVLGAIDSLDPSLRRLLAKRIASTVSSAVEAGDFFHRASRSQSGTSGQVRAAGDLPPAARTILDTIEKSPPGTYHLSGLEKRGAGGLVSALADRDLVCVLPNGLIVSALHQSEFRDTLAEFGEEIDSREAARIWGTSSGFAAALLVQFARDGAVDVLSARRFRIRG